MFKTRLLSGIVLVIIALLTIMSGGYVLLLTLLCVSLIGMRELYNAMGVHKSGMDLLELAGYLGAVLYYGTVFLGFEKYGMMAVILSLVLLMFVYVFTYPKYQAEQVMSAFFGLVYVAVMLSFILLTRNLENGHLLVWLIFFCSWGCDTCAYCVGVLINRGSSWRSCRSSRSRSCLCGNHSCPGSGICGDLRSGSPDFHGWRSGSIRH